MSSPDTRLSSSPSEPEPTTTTRRDSPHQHEPKFLAAVPSAVVAAKRPQPKPAKAQFFETPAMLGHATGLKDDLKDIGFSAHRVREVVARPEPLVDGHAQVPPNSAKQAGDGLTGERVQRGVKGKYEHLYLAEGTNWVLFDPMRGYPLALGAPPDAFQKFETFKLGNAKILEFNVVSRAVRIRCTPAVFERRDVVYSDRAGPKFVEVGRTRVGRRRKVRVKKEVLDSEVEDSASEGGDVEVARRGGSGGSGLLR
ncbi:hypothetical protein LTR08_007662 [Meristemomyces frigidus]|nr:hypothetical protein LTR08_007662 [Meristemomyces frigidus]